jgi:hypothetical protein
MEISFSSTQSSNDGESSADQGGDRYSLAMISSGSISKSW